MGETRIGIPADRTGRIIPAFRKQDHLFETEGNESFISLPVLLKKKFLPAPHGVVLKNARGNRGILLVPRIDTDVEVPEKSIYPLPGAIAGALSCFSGIFFAGNDMILILDTEKLVEFCRD
jgi:hypothetical protein